MRSSPLAWDQHEVYGNSQPAYFDRQIGMYFAARIGRWSNTAIGRFYNGRDHSTVCHRIQRIEPLRESDPEVDALLSDLKRRLAYSAAMAIWIEIAAVSNITLTSADLMALAELVTVRVVDLLRFDPGRARDFTGAVKAAQVRTGMTPKASNRLVKDLWHLTST